MTTYSALMSVYYKEIASNLLESVESVMKQTIPPNDFVLVCDGPLTDSLDTCISELCKKYSNIQVIRLEKNQGLGEALNIGLKYAENEIILRMDSDDICVPERAEQELLLMNEYDLVGSWVQEFEGDVANVIGIREVPEFFDDILKFSKMRCPFNHPSVMFKKSAIQEVGGYKSLMFVEDYFLWVRFLHKNKKAYNIQKPLVFMRSGKEMRSRRGGKIYRKSLKQVRKYMLSHKMINRFEYFKASIMQNLFLLTPIKLKVFLYKKFLRR